jgi:hypothetical protein
MRKQKSGAGRAISLSLCLPQALTDRDKTIRAA